MASLRCIAMFSTLIVATAAASSAYCSEDNLLRCFTHSTDLAASYCDGLAATIYSTVSTTTTAESTITTTFTTVTSTATKPPAKRQAQSPSPPQCVTSKTSYSPDRISSACSCISHPITSTTTTKTSQFTVTETTTISQIATTTKTTTISTTSAYCRPLIFPPFTNEDDNDQSQTVTQKNGKISISISGTGGQVNLDEVVKVPANKTYAIKVPYSASAAQGCYGSLYEPSTFGAGGANFFFAPNSHGDTSFQIANPSSSTMDIALRLTINCRGGPDRLTVGQLRSSCVT